MRSKNEVQPRSSRVLHRRRERRRRRIRNLILAAVLLALAVVLPMPLARAFGPSWAAAELGRLLGVAVEVDAVSATWWGPVRLEGLRIRAGDRGSSPVLGRADAARTDLSLAGLLFGRQSVEIVVAGLEVDASVPWGTASRPATESGGDRSRSTGTERRTGLLGRDLAILVEDAFLRCGDRRFRVEGSGTSPVAGDQPERVRATLVPEFGPGRIDIGGLIRRGRSGFGGTLRAEVARLPLDAVPWLRSQGVGGTVEQFVVRLDGESEGLLSLSADGAIDGLEVRERRAGRLLSFGRAEVSGSTRLVGATRVSAAELRLRAGGVDAVVGPIDELLLAGGARGRVPLRVTVADVALLWALAPGLLPPELRASGAGELGADLTFALPPGAESATEASVVLASLGGRLDVSLGSLEVAEARLRDLRLSGSLAGGSLAVDTLHASVHGVPITGEGLLSLVPAEGTESRLALRTAGASHLRAEAPGRGRLEVVGQAEATVRRAADGTVALTAHAFVDAVDLALADGRAFGASGGAAQVEARYDPQHRVLLVPSASLTAAEGSWTIADARAVFDDDGPSVAARVETRWSSAAARTLLPDSGLLASGALRFAGDVALVSSPRVETATVRGHLEVDELTLPSGHRLQEPRADVVLEGGILELRRGEAGLGEGGARGEARIDLGGGPKLRQAEVALEGVHFREALPGPKPKTAHLVAGIVDGTLRYAADGSGGSLDLDLRAKDLVVDGPEGDRIELPAAVVAGRLRLEEDRVVSASGLRASGQGLDVALDDVRIDSATLAVRAEGRAGIDARLVRALATTAWPPDLAVFGPLDFDGSLTLDPSRGIDGVRADFRLRSDALAFEGRRIEKLVVAAKVADRRIVIGEATAVLDGGSVRATGSAGFSAAVRTAEDRLAVTLDGVPFRFEETSFGGPAPVRSAGRVSGTFEFAGAAGGTATATGVLEFRDLTRRFDGGGRAVALRVPDATLEFRGRIDAFEVVEIDAAEFRGDGYRATLSRGRFDGRMLALSLAMRLGPEIVPAVLLGVPESVLVPAGAVAFDLDGTLALRGRPWVWADTALAGRVALGGAWIGDLPVEDLVVAGRLSAGRLVLDETRAVVASGRVALLPGATLDLGAPEQPFSCRLEAFGLALDRLDRGAAAILNPLLFVEPGRGAAAGVKGTLGCDLVLTGRLAAAVSPPSTVDADGRCRLDDLEVTGSAVMLEVATKAPLLAGNVLQGAVSALSGEGSPLAPFAGLAKRGVRFAPVQTSVRIRDGRVRFDDDLTLVAPEIRLVVNGDAGLDGELSYRIGTDLLARARGAAVTDLPKRIPLFGELFGAVSPTRLLDAVELSATVRGNAFRRRADGSRAVEIEVGVRR